VFLTVAITDLFVGRAAAGNEDNVEAS